MKINSVRLGNAARLAVCLVVGGYCWLVYPKIMGTFLLVFMVLQLLALAWMAAWRSMHPKQYQSEAKRRRF